MAEENPPRPTEPETSPATFSSLVLSLALSALEMLTEPDKPGDKPRDHRRARPMIDSLEVLKEKTRGNLSAEEASLLDAVLCDLRLRYLKADSRPV